MVVKSLRELKARYDELGAGDAFIGILSWPHLKASVLIDLLERGIRCFPSPLSQILSSSKTAQAFLLQAWMLPHTRVIARRSDLIEVLNHYHRKGIGPVVSKQDHMHCGHGIRRWENIETLYSFMALSESSYPFVLQPFADDFTDIRVIVAGDYIEAYTRYNRDNFRRNLSWGGTGCFYQLDTSGEQFCRAVMERGRFPFAHIDLMMLADGRFFLAEIALDGGILGANIDRRELECKKRAVLEKLAANLDN
jgi:glutathione synthase/RimK-type ligase-like ATP-grasp enzyme